jgi:Transposase DDE domain
LSVISLREAIEKLNWYALRWRIETFFKILKSGCKIEELKLRTADGLAKLISIYCIISWKIFWITMINRESKSGIAKLSLTGIEIKILDKLKSDKNKFKKKLSDYILKIAKLGGYLARKHDPPPGNKVIWRGMMRLADIQLGLELGRKIVGN